MIETTLDIQAIRKDFPILQREVNGHPLVYLDNAATSQTPQQVIDAIVDYYQRYNANIHRGVHTLSQEATDAYEAARQKIRKHFNIVHSHEVIFTSGTTQSINLVATGFNSFLKEGDEILVIGQMYVDVVQLPREKDLLIAKQANVICVVEE